MMFFCLVSVFFSFRCNETCAPFDGFASWAGRGRRSERVFCFDQTKNAGTPSPLVSRAARGAANSPSRPALRPAQVARTHPSCGREGGARALRGLRAPQPTPAPSAEFRRRTLTRSPPPRPISRLFPFTGDTHAHPLCSAHRDVSTHARPPVARFRFSAPSRPSPSSARSVAHHVRRRRRLWHGRRRVWPV